MKLNYRHSVNTMRLVLMKFKETINCYHENGVKVYEILELNVKDEIKQTCGFFYNATDCAEYINSKSYSQISYKDMYKEAALNTHIGTADGENFFEYKGYTGANALSLYVSDKYEVNAVASNLAGDALCDAMTDFRAASY